ncbi:matrix-binding protein EbhB [Streptococcus suis]|nr:matrix-binding protein EbhB [Streptococcus suis]HEM5469771.1 matrix-binding protein EbhB [Streptococcus suis]
MIYLKDGNIPLNLAYDDDIVQEANSTYQLSFKFPLTDGKWNLLKREVFLLADDLHGEQEFFIFEVKKVNSHVQVYAKQVATLLNYYSINSISVDRVPGQTVMTALAGSVKRPCPFTFFSDILDRHTFNESNVSVMDALAKDKHSVIGQWGGDLVRDKYQVKLLKNGGTENESLFMYKKNLSSYEESENINNLKTRLHLKKIIQGQSEGEEDRVIVVTVDSPLISQYSQIYEADIEVNDQDVTDEASLLAYGQRYFGSTLCDLVENSINLDVKGKSDVSVKMFDTVSVFHERFDVDLRLKITSYHFGPMSKRLKSIGFGKVSQSFGSTVASMVAGSIDKATGRLSASFEQKLQKEIDNANRHFDAEFEKRVEEINDGIEQAQAEAERYADAIKQEIDTEIAQVNQSMQAQSEEHDRQVADILAKTQSVESLANQAKTDAASAIAQALQFENEAIAEATRLDTVERQATETKLATAKSQVISEATRLVETAKSLLSGQIANVSTDLSQTKEAIKLLATKATVDTLTGRVSSAEAMIQVQADQISQRVKTSDFDQAKQRIETAESSITQLGNRITTELSQVDAKIPTSLDGLNLMTGTRDWSNRGNAWHLGNNWSTETENFRGLVVRSTQSGYNGSHQNIVVKAGDVITFSFYAKANQPLSSIKVSAIWSGSSVYRAPVARVSESDDIISVTSDWKRYWKTVHVLSDGSLQFRTEYNGSAIPDGNKFYVAGLKVAKTSLDTGYSESPSDIAGELTTQRTLITQTASGVEQVSTRLTEANGRISSSETQIRQLVSDVSSKVSQTDFNILKRTVEGHTTSIQQTQQSILLKADKTVLEGVKTTADNALAKANTNASQITQTKADLRIANDAISQKVAKTDFNSLTGRVASAETTIRTQAGQIEQRLTSTQVESAINSKGYQTKSQVDSNITGRGYLTSSSLQPYATTTSVQNLVRTTSDSFTQRISQTESRIPTSVSHRNLIAGTSDRWSAYQTINANSNWIASLGRVQFGDSSGIYVGSKVHLYVHISADEITFDSAVTTRTMKIQGPILDSQNVWTWTNWNLYHPFYNKWSSNLTTGNNYRLIKLTATITQEMYQHSKGFELQVRVDGVKTGKFHVRALMVSTGDIFPDYWTPSLDDFTTVTAFHEVRDTVSSHTRTIGDHTNQISQVVQTATGIVTRVGNLETSRATTAAVNAIQTQVSTLAGSWSVRNLTSAGTVLSQLNLNKDGSVKIDGKLVQITGTTYIQDGVITSGKIASLDAGKITSGYLASGRIKAGSIDGSKIAFDEAFFNGLVANQAYLKKLFAKDAFLTAVQAVAVSAKQITGGIAEALNGGMDVNFDESKINFYTNVAAIRRIYTGHPTQFIKFETEGNYSRTIIGSNRNGGEVFNSATFAGIVVENTNNINTEDNVRIYGDNTLLRHAQGDVGWNINSVTQRIVPANMNAESEIWSKHFVAPDKNSKPVRLDTAVAALWDIWNHIIYNNFEFNAALRTHIKARRDNWKFELNL